MTILWFAGLKQKLRHTRLAPGQFPGLTGQCTGRLLRRVTFPNHIAVPLAVNQTGFGFLSQGDFKLFLLQLPTFKPDKFS